MKLIIEKRNGSVYVYRETEQQFKLNECERADSLIRVPVKNFDNECDTSYMIDNSYCVTTIG